MKKYILTITASVFFLIGYTQKADVLYNDLSLQEAISVYESNLEKDEKDGESMYNLANAYRLNNQNIKAEYWFSKAVERSEQIDAKFYYAQMLLMNGKPSAAKEWFENYKRNVTGRETQHIEDFIKLCEKMETDNISYNNHEIIKVIFNSEQLDFSPSYYGDEILFVSNRSESRGASNKMDGWTDGKFTDLFVASPDSGNHVRPFSKRINSSLHESSGVFTKDLNTLYFTRSNQVKGVTKEDVDQNVRLQIMETNMEGEKWSKPQKLPFNNDNYSYCHPTLSIDGSTMIFASDQPGGFGGMDLYIVKKEGDTWGVPENMGDKINTSGNEVFPFLDEQHNLYFSSNFHAGFGGLDIFKSKYVNAKWRKPSNVGAPINSVKDDFGIITQDDFQTGYFSSHRSGEDDIYSFKNKGNYQVKGVVINCETNEIISDADVSVYKDKDLYKSLVSDEEGRFSFDVDQEIKELKAIANKSPYITDESCTGEEIFNPQDGNVELILGLNTKQKEEEIAENNTGFSLCGTVINSDCNYLLDGSKITLINICNGEAVELTSNKNGAFNYPLMKDCKYIVKVEKDYFTTAEKVFSTDSISEIECLDLEMVMNSNVDLRDPSLGYSPTTDKIVLKEGSVIDLYNVYFDLDKYDIRPDAIEELEWVRKVLSDFKEMKVEISAHTDSRASDAYNIKLSKNRANSVRQYLINVGIDADRIVAVGYGETQLKNECADGVECSDLKHQRNRRVEFKVLNFKGEAIVSKEWKAYKSH